MKSRPRSAKNIRLSARRSPSPSFSSLCRAASLRSFPICLSHLPALTYLPAHHLAQRMSSSHTDCFHFANIARAANDTLPPVQKSHSSYLCSKHMRRTRKADTDALGSPHTTPQVPNTLQKRDAVPFTPIALARARRSPRRPSASTHSPSPQHESTIKSYWKSNGKNRKDTNPVDKANKKDCSH